jgi:hypothetical protein
MAVVISPGNACEAAGAEISVSSEVAGLGARSLLTPQIADIWRSAPVAPGNTVTIRVDFGGVLPDLRFVGLAAPRDGVLPGAGATIRVTASATALDGAEALDTGTVPWGMAKGVWGCLAPPFSARWVRFTLTAGATDTYLQLGRLWVGPALLTAGSISYGWQRNAADMGSSERAGRSGVRYAGRGAIYRTQTMTLPALRHDEAETLETIRLAVGNTGQIFAAPFDSRIGETGIFGRFANPPGSEQHLFSRHRATITIEEDF